MDSEGTELEITIEGGAPWGFRLQGGSEFRAPLQVSRVSLYETQDKDDEVGVVFRYKLHRKSEFLRQVTPGGKAQHMGIKEGDYLLTVNGGNCVNASHNDALRLVKAAQGSLVLSILRGKPPERANPVTDSKTASLTSAAPANSAQFSTSASSLARSDRGSTTSVSSQPSDLRSPVASTRLSFSHVSPTHARSAAESDRAAPAPSNTQPRQPESTDGSRRSLPGSSVLPNDLPADSTIPTSTLSFERPAAPGRGAKRLTSQGSQSFENEPTGPCSPEIPEQGGAKNKSWYKQMFKTMQTTGDSHFTPGSSSVPSSSTSTARPPPSTLSKPTNTSRTSSSGMRPSSTSSLPRSMLSSGETKPTTQSPSWRSAGANQSTTSRGWYKELQGGKGGVSSTKATSYSAKTKPANGPSSSLSSTTSTVASKPSSTRSKSLSEKTASPAEPTSPVHITPAPPTEGYSSLNTALSDLNDAITSLQHATEEAAIRQNKKQTPWQPPSARKAPSKAPVANQNTQLHKTQENQLDEKVHQQMKQYDAPESRFDWQKLMESAPVEKTPPSEPIAKQPSPEHLKSTLSELPATKPARPSSVTSAERVKIVEEPVQAVRQPEEFTHMTDQLEQLLSTLNQPTPVKPSHHPSPATAQTTQDVRVSASTMEPGKSPSPEPQFEPVQSETAYQWQSGHQRQPYSRPVVAKQPSPEPAGVKQSPEPIIANQPSPEPISTKQHSPDPIVTKQPSPEPAVNQWARQQSPDQVDGLPTKPPKEKSPEAVPTTNHDMRQQTPPSSVSPDVPVEPELKPGQGLAKSLYVFEAQAKRELSFSKGEHIVLLRRVDANWLEGELDGKKGIFPTSYVQVIVDVQQKSRTPTPAKSPEATSPTRSKSPSSSTSSLSSTGPRHPTTAPPPEPPSARARYSFHAESARELPFMKGDLVTLLRKIDNNWYEGQLRGIKGIFPASYVEVLNPLPEAPSKVTGQRSTTSQLGSSSEKKKGPGRPSDGPKLASPTTATMPASPAGMGKTDSPAKERPGEQWRALYNYIPQNFDELELKEGDMVLVVEQCDDGWFVGTSMRTNKFGTFPGNYVIRT